MPSAHRIAEYGKRHEPFAQYLCSHGFAVVENDPPGQTGYSQKADDLAFGSYNRKFAPNRTEADWLSATGF